MERRLIKLDGTYNFRDYGGYIGFNGKRVKENLLFRSDTLSKLSNEDINKLESLNIRTIIDYRSEDERYNNEDKNIEGAKIYHLDPIAKIAEFASSTDGSSMLDNLTESKLTKYLADENRKFVEGDRGKEVYSEMLKLVLESEGASVQHCTAGKDRTGYGSALVLLLLGVKLDDVIEDYMLTNDAANLKPRNYSELDIEDEELINALKLLEGVKIDYIQPALDAIYAEYDNVEEYVINELDFSEDDISTLRDKYLE